MGQISLSLPSDGTTIEAADVNNPFNTILNEFNGNIDDNNIKSGAAISATKLNDNTLTPVKYGTDARAGWNTGILPAPNSVTALGNRAYSMVFNAVDLTGYISAGMRLRTTRTTAAPNQCTSLNGSTQYYSKTTPAGMTFTDDFTVSAWIKLSSYPSEAAIASRYNGTSGWIMFLNSSGQVILSGINAGSTNFSRVVSYQSVPLNRWVHIAAQLDMSAFTATTITSYVMIDGVDVPSSVSRSGTNPTALVQAGNLEIGSYNAGTSPFPGKLGQVAIYNAKVTQATILASMHQTLSGSETALISAYSFSNTVNDLNTTNANNLSAQASAVATNADSPYGLQTDGTISTTLDYGVVQATSFSTNTTLTVEVPSGNTIATSGGISAVAYSPYASPFGFPGGNGFGSRVSRVLSSSTSSSSSYAALADAADPAVSVYIGRSGMALVSISATGANSGADSKAFTGFAVSGATTIAGSDDRAVESRLSTATATQRMSYTTIVTDLVPGSNTFSLRHKVAANTGTWLNREISVQPL